MATLATVPPSVHSDLAAVNFDGFPRLATPAPAVAPAPWYYRLPTDAEMSAARAAELDAFAANLEADAAQTELDARVAEAEEELLATEPTARLLMWPRFNPDDNRPAA